MRRRPDGVTYSKKISGDRGNHGWAVRFDRTDGYIGITQWWDSAPERVLLAPEQVRELIAFVGALEG